MTGPKLTPAQERALLWLPADGAIKFQNGAGTLTSTLRRLCRLGLAEETRAWNFRLTPAGIEARRAGEGEP